MSNYDADFYQWTQQQAALLRAGELPALDLEHLAEEIEGMGARDRRELISRLAVLLAHLLKWQYQRELRSASWQRTIDEQRRQIELVLEDSPSLKARLEEFIARAYRDSVRAAVRDTGFIDSPFPQVCPYSVEQILDTEFLPEV
jgi:hypothetical protein